MKRNLVMFLVLAVLTALSVGIAAQTVSTGGSFGFGALSGSWTSEFTIGYRDVTIVDPGATVTLPALTLNVTTGVVTIPAQNITISTSGGTYNYTIPAKNVVVGPFSVVIPSQTVQVGHTGTVTIPDHDVTITVGGQTIDVTVPGGDYPVEDPVSEWAYGPYDGIVSGGGVPQTYSYTSPVLGPYTATVTSIPGYGFEMILPAYSEEVWVNNTYIGDVLFPAVTINYTTADATITIPARHGDPDPAGSHTYVIDIPAQTIPNTFTPPFVHEPDKTVTVVVDGQTITFTCPGGTYNLSIADHVIVIPGQTVTVPASTIVIPSETVTIVVNGESISFTIPSQTVNVSAQTVTVPARTINIPGWTQVIDRLLDLSFLSTLVLQYTIGSFEIASFSVFSEDGFIDQYFIVHGELGAFSLASMLNFVPADPSFEAWVTGAKVSIAGVSFYSWFLLTEDGSGSIFGAEAAAGSVTFLGEVGFNMGNSAYFFWGNAWDYIAGGFMDPEYAYDPYHGCDLIPVWSDYLTLIDDIYCLCWSNAYFMVSFPFGCVGSVLIDTLFDNVDGWKWVRAHVQDIKLLGLDWLWIDDVRLQWGVDYKSISRVDIDIKLGSGCFTPYFELNPGAGFGNSGWSISSLELYAIKLAYNWNGVSINAITLFDTANYVIDWGGYIGRADLAAYQYYCASPYDELLEISFDGDACCGGAISFDVKNWFDIGGANVGLFGWGETSVDVSIGIGSNYIVSTGMNVSVDGFEAITLGLEMNW